MLKRNGLPAPPKKSIGIEGWLLKFQHRKRLPGSVSALRQTRRAIVSERFAANKYGSSTVIKALPT